MGSHTVICSPNSICATQPCWLSLLVWSGSRDWLPLNWCINHHETVSCATEEKSQPLSRQCWVRKVSFLPRTKPHRELDYNQRIPEAKATTGVARACSFWCTRNNCTYLLTNPYSMDCVQLYTEDYTHLFQNPAFFSVTYNGPWWEYLHYDNWQMLQIRASPPKKIWLLKTFTSISFELLHVP